MLSEGSIYGEVASCNDLKNAVVRKLVMPALQLAVKNTTLIFLEYSFQICTIAINAVH